VSRVSFLVSPWLLTFLCLLLRVARFPNPVAPGVPGSGRNWALGAAAYIACWAAWIIAVFLVYELVYSFYRRWRVSKSCFTLPNTAISFSNKRILLRTPPNYPHLLVISRIQPGIHDFLQHLQLLAAHPIYSLGPRTRWKHPRRYCRNLLVSFSKHGQYRPSPAQGRSMSGSAFDFFVLTTWDAGAC
jgi:hypothetical protein